MLLHELHTVAGVDDDMWRVLRAIKPTIAISRQGLVRSSPLSRLTLSSITAMPTYFQRAEPIPLYSQRYRELSRFRQTGPQWDWLPIASEARTSVYAARV